MMTGMLGVVMWLMMGLMLVGIVTASRSSIAERHTVRFWPLRAGKGAWGMAGIGAAGRNWRLLVAGIAAALALLVVVGRAQQHALPVAEPPARTTLPALPATVVARPLDGPRAGHGAHQRPRWSRGGWERQPVVAGVRGACCGRPVPAAAARPADACGRGGCVCARGGGPRRRGRWRQRMGPERRRARAVAAAHGWRRARAGCPAAGDPARATAVASGFGAVWVLTDLYTAASPSGTRIGPALLRIDPAAGRVAAALPLADLDRPVALAIGARSVWVQGWQIHQDATASVVVERVDPATLRVVEAFDTGGDADSRMAVGLGSLWVTRPATGDLLHVAADG